MMRTDPRPDEVRQIVERVFSSYQKQGGRRKAERGRGKAEGGGGTGMPRYENRLAGQFPRLFEPPFDAPRLYQPAEDDFEPELAEIDETILIDEGRYVARSYRVEGYMAMWLVAVGIVQFYDDQGRMLTTINLFESLRPKRMAA